MDKLPDELILRIYNLLSKDTKQLTYLSQVSTRFFRISQNPKLWYLSFKQNYPQWSNCIDYTTEEGQLINWQAFVAHLANQHQKIQHFQFDFVEEIEKYRKRKLSQGEQENLFQLKYRRVDENNNGGRTSHEPLRSHLPPFRSRAFFIPKRIEEDPFWIQDPLVTDIDAVTHTGVVATGKHRKNCNSIYPRSEHKILFWEYPSWRLIRTFELNLTPPRLACQIIGIQSIRMPTEDGKGTQKVRFFTLAVGVPLEHGIEPNGEDRPDCWKFILVYRLNDDGTTQCISNVKTGNEFLGREVFLFSDTSWAQSSDGEWNPDPAADKLQGWIKTISPSNANYDPRYTVFLLAIGITFESISGCVQLTKFDIRSKDTNLLDPSTTPVIWEYFNGHITPGNAVTPLLPPRFSSPTDMIASIRLGQNVSCMIHFKYPPQLNHLICTGSYREDELSVYDWRFGVKVGTLPWKTVERSIPRSPHLSQNDILANQEAQPILDNNNNAENTDQEMDDGTEEDIADHLPDVRPWGLESAFVLPTYWSSSAMPANYLAERGFRLIAVGDNRSDNTKDKLEIKVWDISYLLRAKWYPLIKDHLDEDEDLVDSTDWSHRFPWWRRGTQVLRRLALQMMLQEDLNSREEIGGPALRLKTDVHLPYSPPVDFESMILTHTFGKCEDEDPFIPVKYTAYNVLNTSLFLLTEDGKITVMDIETGKVISKIENAAASPIEIGPQRRIKGIDVNVIGGSEVVVTSREGLLRGVVS
ncbi:hypothetical protein K501DRAFT_240008 [Backusella circina FSU 941]|nr:hypothetical protein K501DRAFT_240008 [Backusella circina FSU 941]